MAKKDKAKKPEEPEAEKPEAAEGEEGAPAKKKMAGKTLVLFIILPAVLVLGGGGAATMMLLGGGDKAESADAGHGEADAHGEKKPAKKAEKADDHGGGATATASAEGEGDVGHALPCHEGDPCYYVMPNLMVNLAGAADERPQFLKLDLVLESSDAAAFDEVPESIPRLKDQLNSFLRELRVEDLNGSAGSFRLRRELMKRFNIVMAPAKIDAVLIEGMLIQ
jgi:flagellar protein FliL